MGGGGLAAGSSDSGASSDGERQRNAAGRGLRFERSGLREKVGWMKEAGPAASGACEASARTGVSIFRSRGIQLGSLISALSSSTTGPADTNEFRCVGSSTGVAGAASAMVAGQQVTSSRTRVMRCL